MFKINGKEFDFDATDSVQVALFDKELDIMGKKIAGGIVSSNVVTLEKQVEAISDMFKAVVDVDVLEGVTSVKKAIDFVHEFYDAIATQGKEVAEAIGKYSPKRVH